MKTEKSILYSYNWRECLEYENCEHKCCFYNCAELNPRLVPFLSKKFSAIDPKLFYGKWQGIIMSEIKRDKCTEWKISRKDLLNFPAKASVSVLSDNRPRKISSVYSYRVKCSMCSVVASKRIASSNEVTFIKLFTSKHRSYLSTEEYFTQNNSEPDEKIIQRPLDSSYASRIPQILPCTKEEEVLRNVLESI